MRALLEKELRCALRERLVWVLLAGVPLLVMLQGYLTAGSCGSGAIHAAALGRRMLATGLQTQLVLLTLFLPVYAALNLVRERERRTLDPLLTASESAEALLAGKLLAPAAVGVLGSLLSLPALLALGRLGGVAPWEPLAGFAIVIPAALASSAAGLAAGALGRSSAVALVLATVAGAVTAFGTLGLLRTSVYSALAASFPLGCVTLLLNSRPARLFGWETGPLGWCLLFQGLLATLLYFAALPALARPYRRRALPVRLSALAFLTLLIWLIVGLDPVRIELSWRVVVPLGTLALFGTVGVLVALVLERFDHAGVLCSLEGSKETQETAEGGLLRRLAMSRLFLGLLPWLSTLPAAMAVAGGVGPDEPDGALMTALVLAVVLWMLAWSLLCLAFSGLFGRAWKGWQAAALILSGPIALFVAGGYRLHLQGCGRGACFELPGLLAALGKEASELSPDLHLRVLEGATVMLLVSAALFGLGWALARRRSRRG